MEKYISQLDKLIDDLETFKWVIGGGYAGVPEKEGSVKEETELYRSTIEELSVLFDDIENEFGNLHLNTLKSYEK